MKDGGMDRRAFMARSAVGLMTVGIGLSPIRVLAREERKGTEILYRTLGRTGLRVPLVSFGVMNSDSPDLIRRALDMGITHLDTAHGYLRGNSERVIGRIIEERKCRDKVLVATKMLFARDHGKRVFLPGGDGRHPSPTEKGLEDQLSISLERLRTDYVDILYLHSCHGPMMPTYEPLMKAFTKAKESGKARFIGISTHSNEPETIRAAVDAGVWDVVLTSYNFMQEHKGEVKAAIAYAAEKGVGIVAMKTQGGVKLNQEKKVEVNHGAALKWVLNDENVCTAIPGITTFEQMDLDFGVMQDLALSNQEKRDLQLSSLSGNPLYCQQCESCILTCPEKVEIPTLMRAYMYAQGYGNLVEANLTLQGLPEERGLGACLDCETCTAVCRQGIGIGDRLRFLMACSPFSERTA
jgi:uncharacterized protein